MAAIVGISGHDLKLKCVIETSLLRVTDHCISLYFSSKLSCSSTLDEPPTLEECHHSTFRQFRIKKSQVKSVLQSLDVAKSVGMTGWVQGFWTPALSPFAVHWPPYSVWFVDIPISQLPGKSAVLLLYLRRVQELIQHVTGPSQFCQLSRVFLKSC